MYALPSLKMTISRNSGQELTPEDPESLEVQFILNDGSVFPETGGKLDFANRRNRSCNRFITGAGTLVENKTHLLRPLRPSM